MSGGALWRFAGLAGFAQRLGQASSSSQAELHVHSKPGAPPSRTVGPAILRAPPKISTFFRIMREAFEYFATPVTRRKVPA
jgi:hypothetical protein